MRVLLDTHTMYWYIEGDPQLSTTAQKLIQDASNDVLVSSVSFWEIAIKISVGKWRLNRPFDQFIDIGLNQYRFELLPIHPSHTVPLLALPFHHKDPFDRLLVAQAITEAISIVGNDHAFDAYGITRIW